MKVAGVFFDLYGTLFLSVHSEADWGRWRAAFEHELERHALQLPDERRAELSERFMGRQPPAQRAGHLTLYEQRVHEFLVDAGVGATPAAVREVARCSAEAWHRDYALDPEAGPLLERLRAGGYRLALVSNFDHPPLLRARLADAGIADAFDAVVVSGEIGCEKPNPAAFRPALDALELPPAGVVHVGDSADDVHGARAAGIRPIHIRRDGAPMIPDLDGVTRISRLPEVLDLLAPDVA